MKNTIWIIIFLLIIGGGIYFLSSNKYKNNTNSVDISDTSQNTTSDTSINVTTPVGSATVNTTTPASVSINIKNFAFSPANITVKAGTKVTWVNNDTAPHTVTSDTGMFNSGSLATGQSFSYTFANTGTVNYHCSIHPTMKGSVSLIN